jgi:hypothetical protein
VLPLRKLFFMKILLTICLLLFGSVTVLAQNNLDAPKKKGTLPETLFNLDFNGNFSFDGLTSMPVKAMIGSKNTGIIVGFQTCKMGNSVLNNVPTEINPLIVQDYEPDAYNINSSYRSSSPSFSLNKGFAIRLGYQKSIFRGLYANASLDISRIKADVRHSYYVTYNYFDSWFGEYSSWTYLQETELNRTIWGMRLNTGLGYTISLGKAKKFYLNTEIIYSIIDKSKSSQGKLNIIGGIGFRIGSPAKTSYDGIKEVNTVPVKL